MKLRTMWLMCGLTVALLPGPSSSQALAEEEDHPPVELKAAWKDGLRLESPDKSVVIQLGGRIFNDWGWFSGGPDLFAAVNAVNGIDVFAPGADPDDFLFLDDATEFRAARLTLSGVVHDRVEFKAEYDFAGGDADFKDVWMGITGVPGVGRVRLGHQKEPFSLEELTSSRHLTFMERGLPNLFAPSRNSGVSVARAQHGERWTWSAGVFADTDGFGDAGQISGGPNVTARVTGVPLWNEDGGHFLHLGLSVTQAGAPGGVLVYETEPEAHLLPDFISTGKMPADGAHLYAFEAAWVRGPLSVQGEYMMAMVDAPTLGDPEFSGHYAQVSYFLTGEHRAYKRSAGAFDRLRPARRLSRGGAWEIAVRHSAADLTDALVTGGELENLTLGVNWYLHPNSRFMLNYMHSNLSGLAGPDPGSLEAIMLRFQVDF